MDLGLEPCIGRTDIPVCPNKHYEVNGPLNKQECPALCDSNMAVLRLSTILPLKSSPVIDMFHSTKKRTDRCDSGRIEYFDQSWCGADFSKQAGDGPLARCKR